MAVSFLLILFFGKRLPRRAPRDRHRRRRRLLRAGLRRRRQLDPAGQPPGPTVGRECVSQPATAAGARRQTDAEAVVGARSARPRPRRRRRRADGDADRRGTGAEAAGREHGDRGRARRGARGQAARRHAVDLVRDRRHQVRGRHAARRPVGDDALRRHARSRCWCTSTPPTTCTATAATPTTSPSSACSPPSMLFFVISVEHAADARRLGAGRPLLVRAHRALVGGEAQLRRRPQGVPHQPRRRRRPAHRRDHHCSSPPAPPASTSCTSTRRAVTGRPTSTLLLVGGAAA